MSAAIPFPAPASSAQRRWTRSDIEDAIERLIAALDALDGEADIEDGADDEPSLGAPEGHVSQIGWARGGDADREIDAAPAR